MSVTDTRPTPAPAPATLLQYGSSFGSSSAGTDASPPSRAPRRARLVLLGGVLPLLILAAWWGISASGAVPSYRLPPPAAVVAAGVDLWQRGLLGPYAAISTQRVMLGFAIGSIVGLTVGSIVGLSRAASAVLAPTIGAFRAVPSLAWVPLLILYLGFGEDSKVTLVAIGAIFPVYTTVAGALHHVDPHLVEVGRAFGYTRFELLTRIQLPAVVPSIVSGLRLGLAQSWLFLVAAELIASSMGLGYLLVESQGNGRIDRIFLAIITLAVLGKLSDAALGLLERYLLSRWS